MNKIENLININKIKIDILGKFDFYTECFNYLENKKNYYIVNHNIQKMTKYGSPYKWAYFSAGISEIPKIDLSNSTISACILTQNSSKTLELCLKSIYDFVTDIVIIDGGSTDESIKIAKKYTDKIYSNAWPDNFSCQRNFGFEKISSEWAFIIDSDEFIDYRAGNDIRKLITLADENEIDVVWFARKWIKEFDTNSFSYYKNHWLLWPDPQARLVRMKSNPYYEGKIHEELKVKNGRYSIFLQEELCSLNHLKLISSTKKERENIALARNIEYDTINVNNIQLLPELNKSLYTKKCNYLINNIFIDSKKG